jgi:hypothetical protein
MLQNYKFQKIIKIRHHMGVHCYMHQNQNNVIYVTEATLMNEYVNIVI